MKGTVGATRIYGIGLVEYNLNCPRCGTRLKQKGSKGRGGRDGLTLCGGCRRVDPHWREMVTGGSFRETTDEELEQLERELEELCREEAS